MPELVPVLVVLAELVVFELVVFELVALPELVVLDHVGSLFPTFSAVLSPVGSFNQFWCGFGSGWFGFGPCWIDFTYF